MAKTIADLKARKTAEYGTKFDISELASKFAPYYENGRRIEVQQEGYDRPARGYVGITTGWKPVFILVFNRRCMGSSVILKDTDTITAEFNTYR